MPEVCSLNGLIYAICAQLLLRTLSLLLKHGWMIKFLMVPSFHQVILLLFESIVTTALGVEFC